MDLVVGTIIVSGLSGALGYIIGRVVGDVRSPSKQSKVRLWDEVKVTLDKATALEEEIGRVYHTPDQRVRDMVLQSCIYMRIELTKIALQGEYPKLARTKHEKEVWSTVLHYRGLMVRNQSLWKELMLIREKEQ